MKTKYIVVQENENLKIKHSSCRGWQTETFTNHELEEIFNYIYEFRTGNKIQR